ncbi:SGNH/GDSL hydrolase family protein [Hansschlegelia plantiphila]|uniref:Uncharacterized protein n=1 Tax=Hansschlegelia plantiphila TaxID=374655 RepID=A0A9W6MU38_9HYPH|nr:SGNH/GDSL hydrolase family protein [Hansschlegelia plantiphila]GLK66999.1 hypothetical protein GCM10008179_06370 [Hansschlegelia plantiphila]
MASIADFKAALLNTYRDFVSAGIPATRPKNPEKSDIRKVLGSYLVDILTDLKNSTVQGDAVLKGSWVDLAATLGTRDGQIGEVNGDAGSHTDPITGATVANSGRFTWDAAASAWKWIAADTLSSKADKSELDEVSDALAEVEPRVAVIELDEDGEDIAFKNAARRLLALMRGDGGLQTAFFETGDGGDSLVVHGPGRRALLRVGPDGVSLPGYAKAAAVARLASRVNPAAMSAPIFGPHLFFTTGSTQLVHPHSIQPVRTDGPQAIVTIEADAVPPAVPHPPLSSRDDPLVLTGDLLTGSATLITRAVGGDQLLTAPLTVLRKATPVTGSPAPKVLLLGDSITNRQTGYFTRAYLTSWGFAPLFVGTMGGSTTTSTTQAAGPLGEGREGWAYGDYFGVDTDDDCTSVVAAGGETAYQALSKADKLHANPFLRAAVAGDPANRQFTGPYGTFVFDFAFYLSRFALATPDVVLFNLGMNDVLEKGAAAVDQVARYLPIMLESLRAAAPSAKIVLWQTIDPKSAAGDTRWSSAHRAVIAKTLEVVLSLRATDANIYFLNVHAAQSAECGFARSAAAADAVTGVSAASYSDITHPTATNRTLHARMLADAIACLSA